MNRRPPETSAIDTAQARAQFALYRSRVRPEMLAKVTLEDLVKRFKLPRAELEAWVDEVRQGRLADG